MRFLNDKAFTEKHGPGVIAIFTATLGRYREFDIAKESTVGVFGTEFKWAMGLNASFMMNKIIREMKPEMRWIWFQGDDHLWHPDLLIKLLARDVDMVAPLMLQKAPPFSHVVFGGDFSGTERSLLNQKKGLVDISGKTIGNGGLLVRRRVLDEMKDPWYETGQTDSEYYGGDIYFVHKAQKETGAKLYIDMDNTQGHIFHGAVWPQMDEKGVLGASIGTALDFVNGI